MCIRDRYKNSIELVIANNDAMALGAIDAYEKLGVTESNVPAFFGAVSYTHLIKWQIQD